MTDRKSRATSEPVQCALSYRAHAYRAPIIHPEGVRAKIGEATVLIDGFGSGAWKVVRGRHSGTLSISTFGRVSEQNRAGLTHEGIRLLAFLAPQVNARHIEFAA